MKKLTAFVLALICVLGFAGCGKSNTYQIAFTVPAGGTEEFLISDEEISATGKKITVSSNQELGDASVILIPVIDTITPGYVETYITPGGPAEFDAVGGEWFKIGLRVRNETDTDKTVCVTVSGVEIRIE